jgi:cysteine synthase
MRKTVLTILGALLIAGSTVQMTAAAERHVREADRAAVPTSQQFRNANNSLAWPSAERQSLSDYSEGHVISAPAGR